MENKNGGEKHRKRRITTKGDNGYLKNNGGKWMTKGKKRAVMSEVNTKTCV